MHRCVMGVVAILLAASGAAGPALSLQSPSLWLSNAEIQSAFKNATIDGRYANGRAFTESYRGDGSLLYLEASTTLGGHWSVTEGTLCTIYDGQDTGGCYRVSRVATNCFEFYFVSRTEEAAPGPSGSLPRWTARGSLQGKPDACQDQPTV